MTFSIAMVHEVKVPNTKPSPKPALSELIRDKEACAVIDPFIGNGEVTGDWKADWILGIRALREYDKGPKGARLLVPYEDLKDKDMAKALMAVVRAKLELDKDTRKINGNVAPKVLALQQAAAATEAAREVDPNVVTDAVVKTTSETEMV
jgi:hypothetical protein